MQKKYISFLILSVLFIIILSNKFIRQEKFIHRNLFQKHNNFTSLQFYPCIAVIVEFRSTQKLISVVHNVNYHIPSTWPVQIFHGQENEHFIRNSTLSSFIKSGKIFLTLMESAKDRSKTDELFTNANFWKQIPGEKILVFQVDSVMCSNSPHKIDDYLQYDYVGAPWDPSWYPYNKSFLVGNGGFSLRSRKKTLQLLALVPYNSFFQEDVWYAQNLHRVNASVAPFDVAKTFSVETLYYERPLGIHRYPWRCDFRKKISETCPESVMVLPNGGC